MYVKLNAFALSQHHALEARDLDRGSSGLAEADSLSFEL
jgi:hypothetical protein